MDLSWTDWAELGNNILFISRTELCLSDRDLKYTGLKKCKLFGGTPGTFFSSFPTRFPTLLFSKFWIPDIPYIKFSLHGHIGPYTINSHTRHYKTSKSYTNPNKTKDVWDCLYACEFRTYWDAGASKKYHLLNRSSCTQYFHISVKNDFLPCIVNSLPSV